MKTNSIKKLSLLIAIGIMIGSIAGCSTKPKNSSNVDQAKVADAYDKLPKEISVLNFDRGAIAASEGTLQDNRWTKWINEQSGIKVNWVSVPRGQSQAKTNVLVATGQAPDVIMEYDRNFIAQLKDQGAIQPIDEFINKYSTKYKAYMEANPDLKAYTNFDGKNYAFTSRRLSVANHAMFIRQDWLDKLGLKAPTTVDELLAVAKAFKEKDPDGNGKDDSYGIAFNNTFDPICKAIFDVRDRVVNGKVVDQIDTENYKDYLAFQKTLYDGGLIDKEFITDKEFKRGPQFFMTGKAGIYMGNYNYDIAQFKTLKQNDPKANVVPLDSVSTKYGKFALLQETPADRYLVINKDCKNPKAVVEFMDWLIDKNWSTLQNGIEGQNYKLVNGLKDANSPEFIAKNKLELNYTGEYFLLSQNDTKELKSVDPVDPIEKEYKVLKDNSLALVSKMKFPRDFPFAFTSTEYSQITADMTPIIEDLRAKAVIGGTKYSVNEIFDKFKSERKRLGGDKIDQQRNEWYTKNKVEFEAFAKQNK